jgi:hypothetical protein
VSRRRLIVSGVVLMAAGGFVFAIALVAAAPWFTTDIEEEAFAVVEAPGTAVLEPGNHQWWVRLEVEPLDEAGIDAFMSEVELAVEGDGRPLPIERADWQSNFGDFSPYAFVEIPESGEYVVDSDRARTFYLTEPLDASETVGVFALGIIAALALGTFGVVVLVLGLTRHPESGRVT